MSFYSEGKRIFGNLHCPYENAPCIVTLHGLESSKDEGKWPFIASKLCENGYACLRFSFQGCGVGNERSEGNFEDVTLTRRLSDYTAALRFLEDSKRVDTNRVGVIGSSFGGMVAIAQDITLKAMVTLATPYKILRYEKPAIPKKKDGYYILPSGRKIKGSFYEDLRNYDLLQAIKHASPILIVHGSSDKIVPIEHAYKMYEAASEPKRIEKIENADHIFASGLEKIIELSLHWFEKYL
ncbi:MAG: alpha/beta fold hydrolase [Candidatus Bathyarchaeota archaeon]